MNFVYIKGPEILDKYIGGSEANVRRLFEEAEMKGPSILFFDEFDSIVPMRNSATASVTDRLVNQFLCYLDGVVPLKNTFVIAATGRPDLIDTAVIRPGRIDTHVFFDLPCLEDRKVVFDEFVGFEFYEKIVKMTEGYSFADLETVVTKLHELKEFDEALINECVLSVKPVSKSKDYEKLKQIYQNFRFGKRDTDVKNQKHILK